MTSFLIIAFVTIISSTGFSADLSNNYSLSALIIGIVGFLLSYLFSIVNFMNARLIHDMELFLRDVVSYGHVRKLPDFGSHVSNMLVPKHRFRYKYFLLVYCHTVAFGFGIDPDSPFVDTEAAGYRDGSTSYLVNANVDCICLDNNLFNYLP